MQETEHGGGGSAQGVFALVTRGRFFFLTPASMLNPTVEILFRLWAVMASPGSHLRVQSVKAQSIGCQMAHTDQTPGSPGFRGLAIPLHLVPSLFSFTSKHMRTSFAPNAGL